MKRFILGAALGLLLSGACAVVPQAPRQPREFVFPPEHARLAVVDRDGNRLIDTEIVHRRLAFFIRDVGPRSDRTDRVGTIENQLDLGGRSSPSFARIGGELWPLELVPGDDTRFGRYLRVTGSRRAIELQVRDETGLAVAPEARLCLVRFGEPFDQRVFRADPQGRIRIVLPWRDEPIWVELSGEGLVTRRVLLPTMAAEEAASTGPLHVLMGLVEGPRVHFVDAESSKPLAPESITWSIEELEGDAALADGFYKSAPLADGGFRIPMADRATFYLSASVEGYERFSAENLRIRDRRIALRAIVKPRRTKR